MTYSMTGYGKHSANYKGRVLTIEIRTLNSKQWDLNLRMPAIYRDKEFELRDLLSTELYRGKIDIGIQRDLAPGEASAVLNEGLATSYYNLLKHIEKGMVEKPSGLTTDYLHLVLKMPDVLKPAGEDLEENEYAVLREVLVTCIQKVQAFRLQEGAKLEAMLIESVQHILNALVGIVPFESERVERIRGRITGSLSEELEGRTIDKDRLEQELIFYIEKLDVSEEKMRLKAHCDYFIKTIQEEKDKGKKLSFISQEMGREINTLGSKAQHSEIQRIVVGMKDELEKIKEQVLNIL